MSEVKGSHWWSPWVMASRPRTLTAAVSPVLVGTALAIAERAFDPGAAIAALLAAIWIQIGTNMYNDVADYERGTDTQDRLGPMRVTQAGLLTPRQVRTGALLSFGFAAVAGLYLVFIAGWPVLVIGVGSILAGLAYTAGPNPLAYNGFGDLFVLIFFGFVAVCGTVYVQAGYVPAAAWPAALGVGSTITALLVVNTVRDIETDRRSGRRTIPVVFGREAGVAEYGALLLASYVSVIILRLTGSENWLVLLPLLTIPMGFRLFQVLRTEEGATLNKVLAGTARFVLIYGLLLSIGIILASLYPSP